MKVVTVCVPLKHPNKYVTREFLIVTEHNMCIQKEHKRLYVSAKAVSHLQA